jgi:phosphate transport system substrate-binding protein
MKFKRIILLVVVIAILYMMVHPSAGSYRIDIVGSTSVQPVAEKLVTEYLKNHSDVSINVQGGGSGLGIRSTQQKIANIGMSSVDLSSDEEKNVSKLILGSEGIVVCVNKANSINNLSIEQVKNIFNGKISNWKELGGSDSEIHVISREDRSGTRQVFESEILNKTRLKKDAIIQSSTNAIEQAVSSDKNAIGYISYISMKDDVKGLSIDGVTISNNSISNKSYKLLSPYFFLIHDKENKHVKDFLNWVFSPEGIEIIKQEKVIIIENELENIRNTVSNIPDN